MINKKNMEFLLKDTASFLSFECIRKKEGETVHLFITPEICISLYPVEENGTCSLFFFDSTDEKCIKKLTLNRVKPGDVALKEIDAAIYAALKKSPLHNTTRFNEMCRMSFDNFGCVLESKILDAETPEVTKETKQRRL